MKINNKFWICTITLTGFFLILTTSCKKDEKPAAVPILTTITVSDITYNTASCGGNISFDGGSEVTARGVCWNTSIGPTISDSKTTNGTGTGSFTSYISGLNGGIIYYVRAYARNSVGTGYGLEMTFTTLGQLPDPMIKAATNITTTSAILNGSVNANFLPTQVTFHYGTTTAYGSSAYAIQSPITGDKYTNVSATIAGLTINGTYHYRVEAINSLGKIYSNDTTFTAAYTIGANTNGGIVFYIDGSGQHGLVCAPYDQSTGATWGCYGTRLIGAAGRGIGTGYQNTNDIINECSTAGIAAKICYDLVLNGYSDWFLPSRDELNLMYINLKLNGFGGFNNNSFWSSSQFDYISAYYQHFVDGYKDENYKNFNSFVRAIRAF